MPIGPLLGMIMVGFITLCIGSLLYSSYRRDKPHIEIWWVPENMRASDDTKRIMILIGALGCFIIGAIILLTGILALLRSI